MFADLLRIAWRTLWRNRRRTLITLAALAFSVMLVQAFHNLSFGVYRGMIDAGVRAGAGHLAVYRGDYVLSRDEALTFPPGELLPQTAALAGVEAALPRVYLPGLAQSSRESRGILLTGVEPEVERRVNPFLRGLADDAMLRDPAGRDAVIGRRLLEELKIEVGGKFVVTVQSRSGELASELFRVRGVIESGIKDVDRSLVVVGRERAALMAGAPGEIHELAVVLSRGDLDRSVFPRLAERVASRPELRLATWEEAIPNLANAIKLDYAGQKFIFIIILLIVTIGVVNTLLMSVLERIREFGVILAIGATPARLAAMVLTEALVLGAAGGVVGSVLGALATWYLATVGIDLRDFISGSLEFGGVVFDPVMRALWDVPWMIQIALYVVGLTLLAALYPALKAARLAPAKAMRYH